VDTLIGRIHGEFATPNWVPIHYMFRGLPESEVVALYRAADALLVTPVRDGMNLVAKEFIGQPQRRGRRAGAERVRGRGVRAGGGRAVNPFDVAHMADSYDRALRMGRQERRTRMRALRRRVFSYDVHHWAHASSIGWPPRTGG
jgi:trehalose 6-phosphate synthase/phosphatase